MTKPGSDSEDAARLADFDPVGTQARSPSSSQGSGSPDDGLRLRWPPHWSCSSASWSFLDYEGRGSSRHHGADDLEGDLGCAARHQGGQLGGGGPHELAGLEPHLLQAWQRLWPDGGCLGSQ